MRDCEYRSQEHFNYSGVMKNASGKNRAWTKCWEEYSEK
jgi:hypothetical protein